MRRKPDEKNIGGSTATTPGGRAYQRLQQEKMARGLEKPDVEPANSPGKKGRAEKKNPK